MRVFATIPFSNMLKERKKEERKKEGKKRKKKEGRKKERKTLRVFAAIPSSNVFIGVWCCGSVFVRD